MDQNKKIILIIEDELALLSLLQNELSNRGYQVEISQDGEEGLIKAKQLKPDLLLLDMILPKLDGISIIQELKKDENTKSIPIIILSNLSDGSKVEQAKQEEIAAYLIKTDWKIKDVIKKIQQVLSETQEQI